MTGGGDSLSLSCGGQSVYLKHNQESMYKLSEALVNTTLSEPPLSSITIVL